MRQAWERDASDLLSSEICDQEQGRRHAACEHQHRNQGNHPALANCAHFCLSSRESRLHRLRFRSFQSSLLHYAAFLIRSGLLPRPLPSSVVALILSMACSIDRFSMSSVWRRVQYASTDPLSCGICIKVGVRTWHGEAGVSEELEALGMNEAVRG